MARPVLRLSRRVLPALIMALFTLLSAQSDERLRLISADLLETTTINGQEVQVLSGHVVFRKGEMQMSTRRALYYRSQERTHFSGDVKIIRPDEELTCDSLVFYSDEDRLHAWGDVHFHQKGRTIISREFLYWTQLDSGIARGEVLMTQGPRQLTAAEFHTRETDGIRGASFQAFGAVVVDEGNRRVSSDRMVYDDIAGVLDLMGDALVEEGDRNLRGETITLSYRDDVLESVQVANGAEATAQVWAQLSEDEDDWQVFSDLMTSRHMTASFIDDHLATLRLEGMATSIYHVVEDSILQGTNHATGDTIILGFDEESELVRIQVSGGARGRFEPEEANSQVDTVVIYKSDYIDYDIPAQITYLDKEARVDYRENGLAAGKIMVTWEDNLLRAEPEYDESPTLYQAGQDPMVGQLMEFDLVSERGRVVKGRTKLDNGYYHGELLHRHPGDVFYVQRSLYTTCDLDRPHFYFAASRMKMIQGDKVIAKPVVLYLMDVPLLGLPFAVFPNKAGGRRSGWIMPSYGESRQSGQYLQGLGYFWAVSDYLDITSLLDLYTKRGLKGVSRFRYSKRYRFNGSGSLTYFRLVDEQNIANLFSAKSSLQWSASWRHAQTIDPTQRLNVDARYTSNPSMNRNFGTNLRTRLNQQIVSSASYSKNWRSISSSLTVALRERYDLQAATRRETAPGSLGQKIEERTRTLPRIRFSRSSTPIIKQRKGNKPVWYNNIFWSLNSNVNNSQSVFWEAAADSAQPDSLFWPDERSVHNRFSAQHNLNFRAQQNVFRYISLSLNMGINEGWVPSYRVSRKDSTGAFIKEGNVIQYDEVTGFASRRTGQLSLSAQTNIYGLFPIQIGSLQAIRHVIKPSISYSYTPDFSRPILGYDFGYVERQGDDLFDKFAGSPIGGTPSYERQAMSIAVSNLFQAKQEVDGKELKPTILRWDLGTSYNFTADSLKLSPIRSSFRSPFLEKLNLDVSMVHDFYAVDERNRRINQILSFPRLAQMNASTRLRLAGSRFVPLSAKDEESLAVEADTLETAEDDELDQIDGRRKIVKPTVAPGNLWEATLSLRYRLQPSLGPNRETFWLEGNLSTVLGKAWRVRYTARFDMLEQSLVNHDLQLYRKLHCWEFAFSWTPTGLGQGFLLRINVIDADLKDIKYESRGGRQSVLGAY